MHGHLSSRVLPQTSVFRPAAGILPRLAPRSIGPPRLLRSRPLPSPPRSFLGVGAPEAILVVGTLFYHEGNPDIDHRPNGPEKILKRILRRDPPPPPLSTPHPHHPFGPFSPALSPPPRPFFGGFLLPAVVALAVFGPKGLAEAAKSAGSAVKAFAPTIREVAAISTDLKTTIEDEIGLDEIRDNLNGITRPSSKKEKELTTTPTETPFVPRTDVPETTVGTSTSTTTTTNNNNNNNNSTSATATATATAVGPEEENPLDVTGGGGADGAAVDASTSTVLMDEETDLEEMRRRSAEMAGWGNAATRAETTGSGSGLGSGRAGDQTDHDDDVVVKDKAIEDMSVEELKAELARRKEKMTK